MSEKYKEYASILLRIGISLVFLWFGLNQLINPLSFLGYVPSWIYPHSAEIVHEHAFQSLHSLPLTPHIIIMGNGLLEVILGLLLIIGLFTRASSLLLSLHIFGIIIGLGYNDIAVRDFGLMLACLSIFLHGPDKWCLDRRAKRIKNNLK